MYVRIAVRDDEFEAITYFEIATWTIECQDAVLVAAVAHRHACRAFDFGHVFDAVGGESLDTGVGSGAIRISLTDDRRHYGQRWSEVLVDGTALAAAGAIFDIHKNIRAALQLGHSFEVGVNVVSSGASARHDLHRQSTLL